MESNVEERVSQCCDVAPESEGVREPPGVGWRVKLIIEAIVTSSSKAIDFLVRISDD